MHPEKWREVRGPLQINSYLFDGRDFGDAILAKDKNNLKWWLRVGIVGIALYLPTLLSISHFGDQRTDQNSTVRLVPPTSIP